MKRNKKKLSKKRTNSLIDFQKKLNIRFRNISLLNTALSHKSYVNEQEGDIENYEKLEFLGDSFLGLVVSDILYNQNLYFKEGSLARIKSYVVSEATLHRVGKKINIQNYVLIGKGEEKSGGRYRRSLIGDSVEALIGAYYLDAGHKNAKKLVEFLFFKEILEVEKNRHEKDYKSILQEYCQKKFRIVPRYSVVNTDGPDHRRKFYVEVSVRKRVFGPGIGDNKKQAEQKAARIALSSLKKTKKLRDPNIEKTHHEEEARRVRKHKRPDHSGQNVKT